MQPSQSESIDQVDVAQPAFPVVELMPPEPELSPAQAFLRCAMGKERVKIPGAAEHMIRAVYEEHIGGNRTVTEILSGLAELDDMVDRELSFEDTDEGWRPAEAA